MLNDAIDYISLVPELVLGMSIMVGVTGAPNMTQSAYKIKHFY